MAEQLTARTRELLDTVLAGEAIWAQGASCASARKPMGDAKARLGEGGHTGDSFLGEFIGKQSTVPKNPRGSNKYTYRPCSDTHSTYIFRSVVAQR